ncbi:MAG: hypothetical protein AAGC71_01390 [Pseudomonadota bacterium]
MKRPTELGKNYQRYCAFLSMDQLDSHCDDELAIAPLAALGINVETVSWRAAVDWDRFDWVIVRSTWDYQADVRGFIETLKRIDASTARLANPLPVIRDNIDKRYLARLADKGVPIVPTRFGDTLDTATLQALLSQRPGRKHVIKPVISAGSYNTFIVVDSMAAADLAPIAEAHSRSPWMLQPFVDSVVTTGEYSVFVFAGELSHCILKTPTSGDFRVQEEFGGNIRAIEPPPGLTETAFDVYRALATNLLFARIDLVEIAGEFAVMEVELVEPSLYLRTANAAARNFASACRTWFDGAD